MIRLKNNKVPALSINFHSETNTRGWITERLPTVRSGRVLLSLRLCPVPPPLQGRPGGDGARPVTEETFHSGQDLQHGECHYSLLATQSISILTVGLPASRLGGVFPNGDMLLLELLVLPWLLHGISMCFGAVILRPPDCGGRVVILSSSSSLM